MNFIPSDNDRCFSLFIFPAGYASRSSLVGHCVWTCLFGCGIHYSLGSSRSYYKLRAIFRQGTYEVKLARNEQDRKMNKTSLISPRSKICKQRAEECVVWWVKRLACKNVFNYLTDNLVPERVKIKESYLFI